MGENLNNVRRNSSIDLKIKKIKYPKQKINKLETKSNKIISDFIRGINICIKSDLTNRRYMSAV
jgi:hypothetical protein